MGGPPQRVEKLMALKLADFHRSLKTLAPDVPLENGQATVAVPAGDKSVQIEFEAQQGATLGRLLALPRARVTLNLDALDAEERTAFLARFDQAFQRGGG